MNTYTLESFINFCDDMMIAEESAHQIKVEFKKEMKQIELLRKEAATIKGDIKKTLECYIKAEKILEQLQSKVNSMDVSTFDKAVSGAATIISIATGVGAAIGMNVFFKKALNESHAFTSMIVGSIAGGTVGKITKGARNRKYTKNEVLACIVKELRNVKICIEVLKNPENYKQYLSDKIYTDEKLINAYDSNKVDMVIPFVNDLIKILTANLKSLLKDIGCNGEFIHKNNLIVYTDQDTFYDVWSNKETTNSNWKKCANIDERFRDIVEEFSSKHHKELSNIGVDITADNPDDSLIAVIEFE